MRAYILLDRSGSMADRGLWAESIGSINAYVKELPGDTDVFLAAFDSNGYEVVRNVRQHEWEDVKPTELSPRGGTPLYDATARLLNRAFEDNSVRSAIVVVTDGFENSSRTTNITQVRALIDQATRKDWQILFLGANFDKVEGVATSMGVNVNNTMHVNDAYMKESFRGLGISTATYAATGKSFGLSSEAKAFAVGGGIAPDFSAVPAKPQEKKEETK